MATLIEINERLIQQNNTEERQLSTLERIEASSAAMAAKLGILEDKAEQEKFKNREEELEGRGRVKKVSSDKGTDQGKGSLFKDMLPAVTFGNLLTALPAFLLKRLGPMFLLKAIADPIADWFEDVTNSKAIGDAVFRAFNFGALASVISRRLILPAAAVGAILDEENRAKFEELGKAITNLGDKIANLLGLPELPTMEEFLKGITTRIGNAIDYITKAVKVLTLYSVDDTELTSEQERELKESENFLKENALSFGATVAAIIAAFKPRGTIRAIWKIISGTFNTLKNGIKSLSAAVLGTKVIEETKELTKAQMQDRNRADAKTLKGRDLEKLRASGYDVDSDGNIRKGGKMVGGAEGRQALASVNKKFDINAKAASKFPKFKDVIKFGKGIPFLGTLISGGLLASILLDDKTSDEEKNKLIGGLFGGMAGATALGMLGGAMLGPVGFIGGAITGGLFGDQAGQVFADYLLNGNKDPAIMAVDGEKKRNSSTESTYSIDRERKRLEYLLGRQVDMTSPEFAPGQGAPGVSPMSSVSSSLLSNEQARASGQQPIVVVQSSVGDTITQNQGTMFTGTLGAALISNGSEFLA